MYRAHLRPHTQHINTGPLKPELTDATHKFTQVCVGVFLGDIGHFLRQVPDLYLFFIIHFAQNEIHQRLARRTF